MKTKFGDSLKNPFLKFFFLALILGVTIGYFLGYLTTNTPKTHIVQEVKSKPNYSEIRAGGYQFTNPLLDCDNFNSSLQKNYVDLQNKLTDYINSVLNNGTANHVSVYFRSLNDGPWIGINENDNYSPASLLKVPILIAVLKKAESNNAILKKKILYNKTIEDNVSPNIVDKKSIILGNSYTVDELLEYMIIHSDNNAKALLLGLIGDEFLTSVMLDLGVNLKTRDLTIDFISVKEYSSFYRILYNSSYLSRQMSEKALEILSRTEFKKGIPDKLPKNIKISHKFGERGFADSNLKQLHDCGIVYFSDSPYLLCIMTKGSDFKILATIISDISGIVYNSVSQK
jgi:beta-lactamase class A